MNELAFASIKTISEKLAKKELTPKELCSFYVERFKKYDPVIKSALEVFDIDSISRYISDNEIVRNTRDERKGESGSMLLGIPGLVKDVICQKDQITSCASKILYNYRAPYDATVVARLKMVGAPSLGRANCDEFAMGSSGETSAYQVTVNPWDVARVPGGSSSGPAAAVAAGLVPWSLGTETGGSIRQPAALCGIVGLKPTYGLVSRYGLVAYGSSIDSIGPMTRTVYDNALVLEAIAGHDAQDSTSRKVPLYSYTQNLTGAIKPGLKIGVIKNAMGARGMQSEMVEALEKALDEYRSLGAQIIDIELPMMDHAAAVYFMVSRAEAASNLARFDGVRYGYRAQADNLMDMYTRSRSEGFGYMVKKRIMIGNYVLSAGHSDAYYNSAKKVQALMRQEFVEAFNNVDVLFSPVTPSPAFKFGEVSGIEMDLQDYFTASANLTGIPALAVPCGFSKTGLPMGFQLIGPDFSEALLYQTAYAYEQQTPWHTKHPAL